MNKSKILNPSIYSLPQIDWRYYIQWSLDHWFELILGFLLLHLIVEKDVKIALQFKSKDTVNIPVIQPVNQAISNETTEKSPPPLFHNNTIKPPVVAKNIFSATNSTSNKPHKAQSFYNLTFILSPDYAEKKGIPAHIVKEKEAILVQYLQEFGPIARAEQEQYNIPISITLAQGLLESNAGDSKLAKESSNHFGIKCRSKCKGCTCRNYQDDDFYDMFRVFNSAKESYREHSILLSSNRYKHLKKLDNDYKQWAHGLKKAGYATDKKYAEKLIKIIEALKLYQYDV